MRFPRRSGSPFGLAGVHPDQPRSNLHWVWLYLAHNYQPWRQRSEPAVRSVESPADASVDEPLNILCLDGGAIKGRNLLVMVEEIEAALGNQSVAEYFDLVAGTSIGGCGALFISHYPEVGAATRMGRRALRELQERCFAQGSRDRLFRKGHYLRDERREFMIELCGRGISLRAARGPRAFAIATRVAPHGGLEPFLFRTYDALPSSARARAGEAADADLEGGGAAADGPVAGTSHAALWKAVEATSAAPLYFPRSRLRGMHLADGGLVANDPTIVALREARAQWPTRRIGLVLSLGSGAPRPAKDETVARAVAAADPRARYIRLQPIVRGVSPIDADEPKLRAMEERAREFFRASPAADEACGLLRTSRGGGAWAAAARAVRRRGAWWRARFDGSISGTMAAWASATGVAHHRCRGWAAHWGIA